jgi:DNA mismatch repair protein MutS2
VLQQARAEGELEVAVLKRNIDSLKQQMKRARQPLEAIKQVEEQLGQIEEKVEAPVERRQRPSLAGQQPIRLGERVIVGTLRAEGVVTALGESDAEVQIGSVRLRAKLSDLSHKSGFVEPSPAAAPLEKKSSTTSRPSGRSPGMELDLRGQLAEDALDKLDRYLEQAFLTGLPWVRIIHGKGTGRLRQAVREALRDHPHVASFEEGGDKEGGAGVTVAKLKTS